MAKKYQPSGYQIINLDLSDKTSGTPFTPETDDEKLLLKLLENGVEKPILLHIQTGNINAISFCVYESRHLYLIVGNVGASTSEDITDSSGKLLWTETEE